MIGRSGRPRTAAQIAAAKANLEKARQAKRRRTGTGQNRVAGTPRKGDYKYTYPKDSGTVRQKGKTGLVKFADKKVGTVSTRNPTKKTVAVRKLSYKESLSRGGTEPVFRKGNKTLKIKARRKR